MDEASAKDIIDIARSHAIDLAVFDETFLLKIVGQRMSAVQKERASDYCAYLKADRSEAEALACALNIPFSLFFREPLTYALLEQIVIPGLVRRAPENGELRVWSAGCARGQEAYSLAILLEEQISAARKPLRYRIFATDVSEEALAFAKNGVYGADDVPNMKRKHLKACFTVAGERYAVAPRIRENVAFSRYDLLDDASAHPPESIFGHFDIVSCSNLLLYYQPKARTRILRKLEDSVSGNGFLIVGETERAFVEKHTSLKTTFVPSAIFQRAADGGDRHPSERQADDGTTTGARESIARADAQTRGGIAG